MFFTALLGPSGVCLAGFNHNQPSRCTLSISSSSGQLGNLTIKHRRRAPASLRAYFVSLCDGGKLNGSTFYRVVKGSIIMAGSSGAAVKKDEQFGVFEDPILHTFHSPGVVGLANSGNPLMFGSQLFITLVSSPWLDGRYHALGRVVHGMKVANEIGNLGTVQGIPSSHVEINECYCF